MKEINDHKCLYCINCFTEKSIDKTHSDFKNDLTCISHDGCNVCGDSNKKPSFHRQNLEKGELLEAYIKSANKSGPYDVMLMFSGGKDSIYALNNLKKNTGLKILAYTSAHPYKTDTSSANLIKVLESLDIDHITFRSNKYSFTEAVKTLITGEQYILPGLQKLICGFCTAVLIVNAYTIAYRYKIPFVLYCADPNQLHSFPLDFDYFVRFIMNLKLSQTTIEQLVDYPLIIKIMNEKQKPGTPVILSPYSSLLDHDVEEIVKDIKTLGIDAGRIDPENTNCRLQPVIKYFSFGKYGCFHHVYSRYFSLHKSPLSQEQVVSLISDYKKIYREIACKESITGKEIDFIKQTLKKLYANSKFESSAENEYKNILQLHKILNEIIS